MTVDPQVQDKAEDDELAPLWMSKGVYFFRLGLAIFIGLALFLGTVGCSAPSSNWQSATHLYSREDIGAILATNSTWTQPSPEQIDRVQALPMGSAVAVHFNAPELCGASGCLYLVYGKSSPSQSMFSAYLKPNLPPGTPLIRATDQSLNNYPCLQLHQVQGTSSLKQYTLCVTGDRGYEVTNQIDISSKGKA